MLGLIPDKEDNGTLGACYVTTVGFYFGGLSNLKLKFK
jgi:hypothetical protein